MFQRLFKKISGGFEKGHINRDEFITLVRTITKNLSDIKCIEIFNHFTKKNETETKGGLEGENRPNTARIDSVTSP